MARGIVVRERGTSLLEITIGGVVFLLLVAGLGTTLVLDKQTERVLTAPVGSELAAQRALQTITADLRLAAVLGEDRNGNLQLDAGEDGNQNGYLDADWSLADGAADQPSLTFNMRVDEFDGSGNRTASGVFTGRVRYLVDADGRLLRERDVEQGGGYVTESAVLAKGIQAIRFSRQGRVVTIGLDVLVPDGPTRTSETRVRLLN